jgi:hypothetical protein
MGGSTVCMFFYYWEQGTGQNSNNGQWQGAERWIQCSMTMGGSTVCMFFYYWEQGTGQNSNNGQWKGAEQ